MVLVNENFSNSINRLRKADPKNLISGNLINSSISGLLIFCSIFIWFCFIYRIPRHSKDDIGGCDGVKHLVIGCHSYERYSKCTCLKANLKMALMWDVEFDPQISYT